VILRWHVDGPYQVAFSTRQGGVSEGPFESLNLGRMTGDDPERVDENRRRLCAEVTADPGRLALNWQHQSADVHRAVPGSRGVPGDGLWTDRPNEPMLALAADCLTIAIARLDGDRPALAVLHAGWRGLLEGIVEAGTAAVGGSSLGAAVGPAIGPCCYEVGPEVAGPFKARYGTDVMRGRNLDLWTSVERALRAGGCTTVERFDLCTGCNAELFFSERRTGKPRGTHGVIGLVAG
jgi:YfiH family protein